MANKPTYIIIHHSGVSYTQNPNQFAAIDRYHKGKGWGMIGYHWLIEKGGAIKKGRAENVRGAHARNFNFNSVGICLTGNFNQDRPTPQQKASLKRLVGEVQKRHKISSDRILGHRECKGNSTSCPGTNMMPVVGELRKPPPPPKPKGIGKALASELGSRLLGRKWTAPASFYNLSLEQFIQAIINSAEYKAKRGVDPCKPIKDELTIVNRRLRTTKEKLRVEVTAHEWFRDTEAPRYQGLIGGLEESLKNQREISDDLMVESAQLKGYITTLEADAQLGRGVREIGLAIKNAFERLLRRIENG